MILDMRKITINETHVDPALTWEVATHHNNTTAAP